MMDSSINNGICRCCASEGTFKDMKTSYHWMGDVEIYSEMLKECFDISLISADNGEEGGVCEVCITQLRNASNFKKQVQHTEEQFKLRLQGKLFKSDIVKIEPAKEDDYGNDSDHLESEDFSGPEFEVPIKTESVEEAKPKKRAAAAKATTSRAKKAKTSEGETSTKRITREATKRDSKKNIINISITPTKQRNSESNKEKTFTTKREQSKANDIRKHLQNIRMILLHSNATPIKGHSGGGYACGFCKKRTPKAADLKTHTMEKHNDLDKRKFMENSTMVSYVVKLDITSLQCHICGSNIEGLEQLMKHLQTHGKEIYTNINNHILPCKFDNEVPTCAVCSNTFEAFKALHEHMTVHYRNYICDIFDASSIIKRNLQDHRARHTRKREILLKISENGKSCNREDLSELNKHRHNARIVLKCSNATPIRRHGGIGYACCFCVDQFPDAADLKRHTIDQHEDDVKNTFMEKVLMYSYLVKLDITSLKCTLCEMAIDTLDELVDHLINAHDQGYYTDIKNHIMSFKFENNDLQCAMCPKTFTRFKLLQEHTNGHYTNYICDNCGAGFINQRTLAAHYNTHKIGIFKCEYCSKVCDTYQKKKQHEYSVHIHMQPVNKCGYCNERFKDGRVKDKHLEQVHGVKFKVIKCDACNKTFTNKSGLRTHVRRDHLLERPHECTECDMRFYTRRQLKYHMLTHTGQKRYQCEVCHNSYGKRSTLKEHMRIHLNERAL